MKKFFKIYNLYDLKQYRDEKKFWEAQTLEYKISVLEIIRQEYTKLSVGKRKNGNRKRFRRVFRILKRA